MTQSFHMASMLHASCLATEHDVCTLQLRPRKDGILKRLGLGLRTTSGNPGTAWIKILGNPPISCMRTYPRGQHPRAPAQCACLRSNVQRSRPLVRQQLLLVRQNSWTCVVCVCLSHSSLAEASKQAPNCASKNAITQLAVICRRHAAPSTQAAACFLCCALPPHVRIRRAPPPPPLQQDVGKGLGEMVSPHPAQVALLHLEH